MIVKVHQEILPRICAMKNGHLHSWARRVIIGTASNQSLGGRQNAQSTIE